MKLNTRQAMATNVSKNPGSIFDIAIERKVPTCQKVDQMEMFLCQLCLSSVRPKEHEMRCVLVE